MDPQTPRPWPTADVDALVRAAMDRATIPGVAVAAIRRGEVVHDAAYGRASLELDVPATPATVFPIASVTKLFTATLVMREVEAGRLDLDGPIGALLADLPAAWSAMTPRQLLAHMSGLPDVIVDPLAGTWLADRYDAAIAAAAVQPMAFEPGAAWSYNQTNFVLLAAAVERLAGQPLAALVEATILGPLGLTATSYGDARDVVPGRGPWYSRIDFSGPQPRLAERLHAIWVPYPPLAHPCAGLNTTAIELARFVDAVASGRLLAPATCAAMWTPQQLRDGTPAGPDPSSPMGLGWIVESLDGRTLVGGSGGATVAVRHCVPDGLTVAVLTNCQGCDPDGLATAIVAAGVEAGAGAGADVA